LELGCRGVVRFADAARFDHDPAILTNGR
jgi:hypothetical protein